MARYRERQRERIEAERAELLALRAAVRALGERLRALAAPSGGGGVVHPEDVARRAALAEALAAYRAAFGGLAGEGDGGQPAPDSPDAA